MPEISLWDMLLHSINEMCVDLIQHVEGEFVAGLAIYALVAWLIEGLFPLADLRLRKAETDRTASRQEPSGV
jgi:hypothetical protein